MCLINFEIVGILYYKHGITQPFQMLIYLIYLRHLLRIHLPATQKQISTLLCVILLLLSNVLWSLERLNLWFVFRKKRFTVDQEFNRAETNCKIANVLGNLLM